MKRKNQFLMVILLLIVLILIGGVIIYSFVLQCQVRSKENPSGVQASDPVTQEPAPRDTTTDKDEGAAKSNETDIAEEDKNNSTLPEVAEPTEKADANVPGDIEVSHDNPIVLAFAGDVNLDESSKPVARYDREQDGIAGVFSSELIDEMNNADIMMLNNEFAYSSRGTKTPDKSYTFRANPKRVEILKEMGVDIVSLANNHALDFGIDALMDTFTTLDDANIDYIGAGENIERAKAIQYYSIGEKKIAYLAASRVIFSVDWYATNTRPGMIGTYDPALLLDLIKEAKENSDFVVVYVHWGKERTNYPLDYQVNMAKQYIDAGADAVIGCHPHVLQGMEFYKDRIIAYSLGNFWFNGSTIETGLLKLYLNPDGSTDIQLLPALQKDTSTSLLTEDQDRKAYFDFMEEISFGVRFDEDGFVTEATED